MMLTRRKPKTLFRNSQIVPMGLRFHRRIRVLPGVHLNLSRSGIGASIGGRGAHVGITARGQRYASIGIPGAGVSWREYERRSAPRQCDQCGPGHVHFPAAWVLLAIGTVVALWIFGRAMLP